MPERGIAFAPGHLTAFFSVHYHDDPRRSGSRGAGIAISEGVTVEVVPGEGTELNGTPTTIDAVDRVLDSFDRPLAVSVSTDLPLGMGFGISGAAALATALAADAALGCNRPRAELVSIAHVADVEAGTGLGDVVAQARGGATIRVTPGAPPFGQVESIGTDGQIEYLPLGALSTPDVLAGATDELTRAGDERVDTLTAHPSLEHLVDLGRSFDREVGLLDAELTSVLDAVERVDGHACLGLLGRTIVALDDGLSAAGYEPSVTSVHPEGAAVLDSE